MADPSTPEVDYVDRLTGVLHPLGGDPLTDLFSVTIIAVTLVVCVHELFHYLLGWRMARTVGRRADSEPFTSRSQLEELVEEVGEKARPLKHGLEELLESTFERHGRLHNSIQAAEFIHIDDVLEANSRLIFSPGLVAVVPGLLTALGIFGTFLGLVLGLQGLDLGGESGTGDIGNLVDGLQVAFRSSIWGLLGSMTVTLFHRFAVGNLEASISKLVRSIDARLARRTTEQLLTGIELVLVESKAQLVKLNTDLAPKLAKAIAPTLEEMLRLQAELAKAAKNAVETSSKTQVEGIERIVQKLIEKLEDTLGKAMKEAGAALERFADKQGEQLTKFEGNLRLLSSTTADLEAAAGMQTQAFNDAKVAGTALSEASLRIVQAAEDVSKLVAELDAPVSGLTSAATGVAGLVVEQGKALETLGQRAEELLRGIDLQKESWGDYLTRLEGLTNALSTGLTNFVDSFAPEIDRVLAKFDQELAKAVGRLGTTVDGMREHTEDFDDRVAQIVSSLQQAGQDMRKALPRLQSDLSTAVAETSRMLIGLREQLVREMAAAARANRGPGTDT